MTSERWAGFTDDDIEKMKCKPTTDKSCNDKICEWDDHNSSSKRRRPMKIKKILSKSETDEHLQDVYDGDCICNEEKNSTSAYMEASLSNNSEKVFGLTGSEINCTCSIEENQSELPVPLDVSYICDEIHDPKCEEVDHSNTILPPLEIFEMRQKRIEAENARRRTLISKAINDKKKQTQAEAVKLAKITQELNRLDSSLSADVAILRDYIEKATYEFSEAEKRYLKAEKEFVEAKLNLFEKMQRKEMLTEHLCAIIEQNENRKADKLVELMKQLEMEVMVEDCEINGIQPILPSLCSLNNEPYQSCQTLKPSVSRDSLQEKTVNDTDQKCECDDKTNTAEASNEITDENQESVQ